VAQSDDADFAHEGLPHVTMVYVPAALYRIRPVRILLEQIWLPVLVLRHRIDVLHSVHYSFPLFCPRAKRAVTIHDMTSVTMPEMHIGAKRIHYRFFIAAALRFAEMMIFVSHSSLKDCQRLFHLRDERAEVIHLGLEDRWYRMAAEGAPAGSEWVTKLPKQFVLFVGMIEPRKNIARLVLAFAAVAKEYPECVLVIAGKKGWKYEEVFVNARESGVEERIHFTGFVSDEDKMALMGRATVFAYPSLYEGFGIPVLEALACGVPTLTSDVSSIPEVTGDAALLVNPESTEEIATALRRLLSDTDLREELRTKGMKRAKLFPWSATAERTLGVYEALYAKQRG
jgi:glycosyltransferase involved in cell wall biosynthesis